MELNSPSRSVYDSSIAAIRAAMAENGSPRPRFSTDEGRTYFLVELPVHPDLPGVPGAHDEAHDQAHDQAYDEAYDQAYDDLTATEQQILEFLGDGPKNKQEIADFLKIQPRSGSIYRAIFHLRELGAIELTIPDKPQSKNQQMRLTAAGKRWLAGRGKDI